MDRKRRQELADEVLAGYVSGPAASTQATARALDRVQDARAVVLVEGISDQIALETLARRRGRDLSHDGVVVFPVGGIHAIRGFLGEFGPEGSDLQLAGLCDAAEEDVVRRSLAAAGVANPQTRAEMGAAGFFVCVEDLEDELIRAVGAGRCEEILDAHGDLGSFRTMQRQPAWRGRAVEAQLRRFLGAGARRKLRYARLLVEAVDDARVPRPLDAVLGRLPAPRRRRGSDIGRRDR